MAIVCRLLFFLFFLQPIDTESNEEDYHPAIFTYVFLGLTCFLLLLANLALWIVRSSTSLLYRATYIYHGLDSV